MSHRLGATMQFRLWMSVWKIFFVKKISLGDDFVGECDPNTKTISVLKSTNGRLRLDTLIHEMLHAVLPEKNELWVNSVATDMTNVLWEYGYRNASETKSAK